MKFETLQIQNFKGFKDSGIVKFGPKFNVIVGQNNSGKTALLEALRVSKAGNSPYKLRGKTQDFELSQKSIFKYRQLIKKADIIYGALKAGEMYVPQSINASSFVGQLKAFTDGIFSVETNGDCSVWRADESPFGPILNENSTFHKFQYIIESGIFSSAGTVSTGSQDQMHSRVFTAAESDKIYVLNSQRFSIGKCGTSESHVLSQNASNLPSALHNLQGSHPQKFRKIVQNLMEIFPSVGNMTVTPIQGTSDIEVIIWPYEGCDNIKEATSLDKCGTGIAQALAILFIAAQEDEMVLAVDEIGSFLHPMAVKNLIRILKQQYSHHQYIISTHHTDVISWSDPDEIILVRKVDNECSAMNISLETIDEFENLTGELGISMADVFGSDQIIWVEGETEELCFPLLLQHRGTPLPKGTNLSKIIGTGNLSLKNRNAAMAFDIYDKVSRMASPLTRSCVFTMDRETMSDSDVASLIAKAGNRLLVLNRRCYENYLIEPQSLETLLTALEPSISTGTVATWLETNGGSAEYDAQREWNGDPTATPWLVKVNGAKLLADLFGQLTEQRHTYQKTTHSPQLTQIILESRPGALSELLGFAGEIVSRLN